MEEEEEDRRRESAIASALCLQPNFKPKAVSQHQLSKFRELHKRRLQLKSKSKFKTKSKDRVNQKFQGNDIPRQNSGTQGFKLDDKKTSLLNDCEGFESGSKDCKDSVPAFSSKKQKLHWGLDTKERWERKSNM